jgi:hypothetical protein
LPEFGGHYIKGAANQVRGRISPEIKDNESGEGAKSGKFMNIWTDPFTSIESGSFIFIAICGIAGGLR